MKVWFLFSGQSQLLRPGFVNAVNGSQVRMQ